MRLPRIQDGLPGQANEEALYCLSLQDKHQEVIIPPRTFASRPHAHLAWYGFEYIMRHVLERGKVLFYLLTICLHLFPFLLQPLF